MSTHRSHISLLDADPELADEIPVAEREAAARALIAHTMVLDPGPWEPEDEEWPIQPAVGLLVIDGVLTRDILFAGRTTTELLGAGDVLRPWDADIQFDALPFEAAWHVHEPVQFAVLDARFALAAARWPGLSGAISRRHVRRSRGLAFQLAIAQLPRVDDRLLVLLWSLAERWGKVCLDGVRLPLRLPHRTLATLVGARRPSVTTALTGLTRAGLAERLDDGWMLHGDPSLILPQRLHTVGENHAATAVHS